MPPDDGRTYVAWSKATKEEFAEDIVERNSMLVYRMRLSQCAAYLAQKDIRGFDSKKPPPKRMRARDRQLQPEPGRQRTRDVLDALGNAGAVFWNTLEQVAGRKPFSEGTIYEWLTDNKNNRAIPHRMETAGYVPCRYDGRKDGMWTINKRRKVVYAKVDLDLRSQTIAAQALVKKIEAETPADPPPGRGSRKCLEKSMNGHQEPRRERRERRGLPLICPFPVSIPHKLLALTGWSFKENVMSEKDNRKTTPFTPFASLRSPTPQADAKRHR